MLICPNCSSKNIKLYTMIHEYALNKCSECEIIYTVTKESAKRVNHKFYNSSYIEGYKKRESELKKRFQSHLNIIDRYSTGGEILDIGCGVGFFLEIVTKFSKHIWKVNGVEPNNLLIKFSNKKIKKFLTKGILSKLPFKSHSFDCVTCFDVLEHDLNLQSNLKEIKRILKKDGILVIQTPNYLSLMRIITGSKWDWWALPDHVLHMSFSFLNNSLKQNNYEIIEKLTYEHSDDFLINIKGVFGKNKLNKFIYYLCIPFFLVIERIGWVFNYGALTFIIAKNKI